ncbi:MAG: zinc-binding alcohol dehydrogenase family protein [Deltaproteobacteria bacterium]|nr:MAG: zinc-binding alcohol dehydrogenase family protein [Deltaproteobacteria bacterium]
MRALVVTQPGPIANRPLVAADLPDPVPGPGELRVRVRACGVCRTDLHVVEGDLPPVRDRVIPGHQVVGVVDALGPGARRFRVGDRVGIAWLRSVCGACDACAAGRENLCPNAQFTGYHADGGYAEYAVAPEAFAYTIPDAFTDVEAAPLLCAGIIGYRALARAALPPSGALGLYGFGASAHVVLQLARHRGATVYVATRGRSHRALAVELGAAWAGAVDEPPPAPLDSAIVFAPAGAVVPPALRALKPGGTCALAGVTMTDLPAMAYEPHLFREKTLTSVTANTRADGEALLREAAAIPVRPRVATYPLEAAPDALADLAGGRIDGVAVLVVDGAT